MATTPAASGAGRLIWQTPGLRVVFATGGDAPVALRSLRSLRAAAAAGVGTDDAPAHLDQPLVEISALGHGRFPGSFRHVDTVLGARLRYQDHTVDTRDDRSELRIRQLDPVTRLRTVSVFVARGAVPSVQTWTEVDVDGPGSLTVDSVSSFATGAWLTDSGAAATPVGVGAFDLLFAHNDWLTESRWRRQDLREIGLPEIDRALHGNQPRSRCLVSNRGAWSTGEALPTGVLLHRDGDYTMAWQIEHNGPWSYELGEARHGAYLLLTGPTDQENQWTRVVSSESAFVSVPVSVAIAAGGPEAAFAVLTDHRRAIRHHHDLDASLPLIFNDYMNTLMGDPTTATLLPLIDAAADVGADVFCIDAGWYAEGHWWDTVGAWQPAAGRFPGGGLPAVIEHIRSRGMVAGLWLEPEVIGIHSSLASTLPDHAFFSRQGIRIVEHGRHVLDLRSPAALAHLDEVVDRIVGEYGVGFIKLDHNTMPGPGTDSTGSSVGHGLLEHNRALLRWLDDVHRRHPALLIENCSSGAMRMDYAMLSRLHLQSTSDQQDPIRYASIAAAAPASVLPEQAGNWAYPATGTDPELFVFALANAVLGRMYLSGYLNRMTADEIALVRQAIAAQRTVLATLDRTHPWWPLGLPGWTDPWVALALDAGIETGDGAVHLTVWRRPGASESVALPLPRLRGRRLDVTALFPVDRAGWEWSWDPTSAVLTATVSVAAPTARVLRITDAGAQQPAG